MSSPAVSQNVLLSSVVPEFDPLKDDIGMWVNVVEANADAFGWSDRVIKYQALQKLRNTAKVWYDSLQKNETKWTTWKWKQWRNKLLDTFQTSRNMYNMLKELVQVKPSEGQSLYEFYFQQKDRIDRLRLNFSDKDIIAIIVGAIGDKNIATIAETGNFRYCDDLASFLHGKTFCSSDQNNNITKPSVKHNVNTLNVVRPTSSNFNYTEKKLDSSHSVDPSNNINRNTLSCFRCGEVGHKKTNCNHSDTVTCNFCKRIGHLELACRTKSNQTKTKV